MEKIIFNSTPDYRIQVLFYENGHNFIMVNSRKDSSSIAKPGVPGYGKYPEAEVNRMINFLER
ncbi:hypothetical protein [Ligilactobacillus equi]|uniref:Uncharacterized protein n=1 Tax=Ligilactobacillus equi DSM 15833 = JCM 10991 TaxID=1423740 RepID=A0A0R1T4V4_9LACO|nr:hypothetical protein [Ligilactobacillus equi]KRL76637.1 hypothetical protein FC36_GL001880 [Ligilactobacillus equi DSM 15833 = JCM 10991]